MEPVEITIWGGIFSINTKSIHDCTHPFYRDVISAFDELNGQILMQISCVNEALEMSL